MNFYQKAVLRMLDEQQLLSEEMVSGKKVLLIIEMQFLGQEFRVALDERIKRTSPAEYPAVYLFNPARIHSYNSVKEIYECVGDDKFDSVVLFCGLEKEMDFWEGAANLQDMCVLGGHILVFVRTPLEMGTKLALATYEDEWRYEPIDVVHMFPQCAVEQAVLSEPEYILGMRMQKRSVAEQASETSYPIFNCRTKHRITQASARNLGFFHEYKDLDALGVRFFTDKCHYDHNYLGKYDFFLSAYQQDTFNLLELGVFIGASEYMWQDYFHNAQVYGVDIDPECQQYATERVHIIQADLSRVEEIEKLKEIKPRIIVDDASHLWSHQILALFNLFDVLPSGGVYIIEDMETSVNRDLYPGYDDAEINAYDVCSQIARVVESKSPCMDGPYKEEITAIGMCIEMISFMKGSCVMIKR